MNQSPTVSLHGPWWLAYPDLWQAEVNSLETAGVVWSVDDSAEEPAGQELIQRRALKIAWPSRAGGEPLDLIVTYPVSYPWFPPRVQLPEPLAGLRWHRNVIDGSLCLLGDLDDWVPGTATGDLLRRQLPVLLREGTKEVAEAPRPDQEVGCEPVWMRLPHRSLGGLLIDPACTPPSALDSGRARLSELGTVGIRLHVLVSLEDGAGEPVWQSTTFRGKELVSVPWRRLRTVPDGVLSPDLLWALATEVMDEGTEPSPVAADVDDMVLLFLPSEGPDHDRREDAVLLDRDRTEAPASDERPMDPDTDTRRPVATAMRVRRGYPVGRSDLTARLPDDQHRTLRHAAVAVIGLGAIGSHLALELTRLGVRHLRLVDGDLHDPATSSRHVLNVFEAGDFKALGVALRVRMANPHVDLVCRPYNVGADAGYELTRLIEYDLVIDATASLTTTRYLSAHLRLALPRLLVVSATAGGWGGSIVSLPSMGGGCWECLQLHRRDRTVPWPPADPDGPVLPAGCAEPTYVGSYADLGHVTLQAARTAIDLLSHPEDRAFRDLQVLTLYANRRPTHPSWSSTTLTPHSSCELHP
jgi:hypothetical protein